MWIEMLMKILRWNILYVSIEIKLMYYRIVNYATCVTSHQMQSINW